MDSFGARTTISVASRACEFFRITSAGGGNVSRLPFSLKILLENLLRFEDGTTVTAEDIQALEAMGVGDLLLGFRRDTLEASLDNMQYFADDIWALAR